MPSASDPEPDPRPLGTEVLDTPAAGSLVIRGGAIRAGGYVAGVALSVLAVAILIRQLGAADYGRYITVISLVTIVGALAEAGMTNLGIREYSTLEGAERDRLMRNLLGLRVAISVLGLAVAVVFALLAGYSEVMVVGTLVAGLGLLLANLLGAVSVPLAARLALGRLTIVDLLRQVVTVVATVALAAAGAGLLAYLAVPLPAAAASMVLTLVWVRGAIPLAPAFDRAVWGRLLRVVASFAAAAAVGTLYVYVIVLVMSLVSSDTEIGYFGASFRVFLVVGSVAGLLVSSAFPVLSRAARDDHVRLRYALQRLFEVSVIVGMWGALCTVLGAEIAIDVVAGPDFGPAVPTLRIQGGAVFASFLLATWGFAIISLHRHAALLVANAIALALSLGFSIALVPGLGAQGAALATVIGETGLALAYLVALVRHSPELRPELGVLARVLPAGGVALGAAVLPGLAPVPAVAVATVVYAVLVLVLRAVPRELLDAAPRPGGARFRRP
ncbi:MAG TPA: oligosaccharide flippase family protein [Solirubrobacteraceae bacterium]|nr:oligosaccharide flippase family protein [Solirubrobacteraceae bacterium]